MSSWGSTYPPPPPAPRGRSRSRSPHRGGPYPPRSSYPDPAFPQEPYRADWEAYDRDRAWGNYERERGGYEYRRRSRSPPMDEGVCASGASYNPPLKRPCISAGRKRRRSLSPWDRDRYEPRPRYNDDYGELSAMFWLYKPLTLFSRRAFAWLRV